jgi:diaminopimelate epimerase
LIFFLTSNDMQFTKMHGIGNDYVYVDCTRQPPPGDPCALARAVSDRHTGIGSDGLILICPSNVADARMRMFNVDGSEGEMCGNGIRCVAKFVHDHGIARIPRLTIETGRGVLTLDLTIQNDRVSQVRVDMGTPILQASDIPTTLPGNPVADAKLPYWEAGRELLDLLAPAGAQPAVTCVSMGNPHGVLFCRDVSKVPLDKVGPILEHAPVFPRRANIHFAQVQSRGEVTMRTWERGSGMTLACGTGACSVCVAGVLTGRTDRELLAHLPGGDLRLHWSESDGHVYMTGPAVEVFHGEWPD